MSNLPPGCSVNDIPGNSPEDGRAEAAIDAAIERLNAARLSIAEIERAVLIGIAAINAEREPIARLVNEHLANAAESHAMPLTRPFFGTEPPNPDAQAVNVNQLAQDVDALCATIRHLAAATSTAGRAHYISTAGMLIERIRGEVPGRTCDAGGGFVKTTIGGVDVVHLQSEPPLTSGVAEAMCGLRGCIRPRSHASYHEDADGARYWE